MWTLGTSGNAFSLNLGTAAFANTQLHYDDLEIYDVALTETQIQNKYTAETPLNLNQLVAYFGFNNSLAAQNNSKFGIYHQQCNTIYNGFNGQDKNFFIRCKRDGRISKHLILTSEQNLIRHLKL